MVNQRIRLLRIQQGINQAELAKRTGRTQSQISKIENGSRQLKANELKVFSEALKVEPSDLFLS